LQSEMKRAPARRPFFVGEPAALRGRALSRTLSLGLSTPRRASNQTKCGSIGDHSRGSRVSTMCRHWGRPRERKMPSTRMTALLALLAVAGYQNRDKLGEMFGRITGGPGPSGPMPGANPGSAQSGGGLGGLLGNLFGGGAGNLSGGLGDLIANM